MNIILSDAGYHKRFAPLTLTRPVGDLRVGILTNVERCKQFFPNDEIYFETEDYLATKFPTNEKKDLIINASFILTQALVDEIVNLNDGEELVADKEWIARKGTEYSTKIELKSESIQLQFIWDIFQKNGDILKLDFELLTKNRNSEELASSNTLIGEKSNLFIEKGASIEACILSTKNGPIYIGKDCEIMEGSVIRGPFAMLDHAGVKLGAKIYGPTTLGPHVKVGGEVSNSIFQAYSNKGHDGFLGNSVLGEWCNLGADTNSSNLKNNYSKVSAFSYETGNIEKTEVQFMGLIMGDHSKSGINTMFNTATVVGVSSNIYGGDFPPKFIPSFSWGGASGFVKFDKNKAKEVAKAMMARRDVSFTEGDNTIFDYLFDSEDI